MLNKNNERELAYVVIIDNITPIEGYDRVELAHVGGWTIVVGKGEFKVGDPAIYFEIDSQLPEVKPFTDMEFLVKKKYKIKTQKMCKSISQGLLISAANLNGKIRIDYDNQPVIELCMPNTPTENYSEYSLHRADDESRFLTKKLGVTYAVPDDNIRKAGSADKYKKMSQRYDKLFSHQPFRWLMKRTWGKKFLFFFFGRKKDKRTWPAWVQKTDEERVQNMPWILKDKSEWIATEKIDGTSTTFSIKRGHGLRKNQFYVCSRNVVFENPDKKCYYDTNVYFKMAEKYDIEEVLNKLLKEYPKAEWITIQGETYGPGIQKRDYSTSHHHFAAFNLIMSNTGRWNTLDMVNKLNEYGVPSVPIVHPFYILPDTIEELLTYATGESKIDGGMREGIVFRSTDGTKSFKAVSNEYLLKYHS